MGRHCLFFLCLQVMFNLVLCFYMEEGGFALEYSIEAKFIVYLSCNTTLPLPTSPYDINKNLINKGEDIPPLLLSSQQKRTPRGRPSTNSTAYILHPRKRKNRYQNRSHFRSHFRSAAKYRTAISTSSLRLLTKVAFPIWRLSMTRSHVLACRYRNRRISSISFLAGSRT